MSPGYQETQEPAGSSRRGASSLTSRMGWHLPQPALPEAEWSPSEGVPFSWRLPTWQRAQLRAAESREASILNLRMTLVSRKNQNSV